MSDSDAARPPGPTAAQIAPTAAQIAEHFRRLTAEWGMLADLCFADLLLFVPVGSGPTGTDANPVGPGSMTVAGQVRPATGQTIYLTDIIGTVFSERERPFVAEAFSTGRPVEGEVDDPHLGLSLKVLAVPLRLGAVVVGVLSREVSPDVRRSPGDLERTYQRIFDRFAEMMVTGEYPFGGEDGGVADVLTGAPRVGDGVVLLDRDAHVEYASPNATSALQRAGVRGNLVGRHLYEAGLSQLATRVAFRSRRPAVEETAGQGDVVLVVRCIPLLRHGHVTGALVLLRDVTEIRKQERIILTKDATIREIHHRVKNNLQTISSLLRLQGRRLAEPSAKAAVEESVRRIQSIALVHDVLSRDHGDDVEFTDIARGLVQMVEDALVSPDRPVRVTVSGVSGQLPSILATPLAVVLNELIQNTIDHGFPDELAGSPEPARVDITFERSVDELVLSVSDNGVGFPPGPAQRQGLGLQIVNTLVTSELRGSLSVGDGGGNDPRPGTRVEVRIPVVVPA